MSIYGMINIPHNVIWPRSLSLRAQNVAASLLSTKYKNMRICFLKNYTIQLSDLLHSRYHKIFSVTSQIRVPKQALKRV